MRITAFIGAALIALCSLAMAPVAMADPAPDICALEFTQPASLDHALATADLTCAVIAVDAAFYAQITGGDEDEAAGPSRSRLLIALDFAGPRLHFDPGRHLG
ncbi:hypothetical protein WH87_04870 [Devosia epidermidihirudinis]|uniref:Uncharacterized protein n=1 Tax=Devosia epidermidihirudinis TaxID=1293439 RepID=A0A0F5QFP9_9HYPH|nr:hypothetical protein [Devosia epidermidihirudinis]KKC39528.1 hypothetical protein WH87_04870 [Devosia epidermidihirudinis]